MSKQFKLPKSQRAVVGKETADICRLRKYTTDSGGTIDVSGVTAAAVAATTLNPRCTLPTTRTETIIEVANEGTLGAALKMHAAGHSVLALNFASAKNPGGGFMTGAEAQEENLARNSLIYACLTAANITPHYVQAKASTDPLYTHDVIYSPHVPVIRDEWTGRLLEQPWPLSFVTAAAPNAGVARKRGVSEQEIRETLEVRAERVLRVAAAHGHDAIVLGAWGCGVFQNDPWAIAGIFGGLLSGKFSGAFRHVTFAIVGPVTNMTPFQQTFAGGLAVSPQPQVQVQESPPLPPPPPPPPPPQQQQQQAWAWQQNRDGHGIPRAASRRQQGKGKGRVSEQRQNSRRHPKGLGEENVAGALAEAPTIREGRSMKSANGVDMGAQMDPPAWIVAAALEK